MNFNLNRKVNTTSFVLLLLIVIFLLIGSISYMYSTYVKTDTTKNAGTVNIDFSQTVYIPEYNPTSFNKMDYKIKNTCDEPVIINKYVYMTIHDKDGKEIDLKDYEDFVFLYHYSDISEPSILVDYNSINYTIENNTIKFDSDKIIVNPGQTINRSYIIDITNQPKELNGSTLHFTLVLESLRRDKEGYYYSDLTIQTFTFSMSNQKLICVKS